MYISRVDNRGFGIIAMDDSGCPDWSRGLSASTPKYHAEGKYDTPPSHFDRGPTSPARCLLLHSEC